MHCPQCGEPFSDSDVVEIDPPRDEEGTPAGDLWLLDKLHCAEPWRLWTCRDCGTETRTIELSVDRLHDLTDDSPSKQESIEEDYSEAPRGRQVPEAVLLIPTPALSMIVGLEPIDAREATRRVYEYIDEHGLEDPNRRGWVRANPALRPLFGADSISVFELSEVISENLIAFYE